jgi:hypothetical protein
MDPMCSTMDDLRLQELIIYRAALGRQFASSTVERTADLPASAVGSPRVWLRGSVRWRSCAGRTRGQRIGYYPEA